MQMLSHDPIVVGFYWFDSGVDGSCLVLQVWTLPKTPFSASKCHIRTDFRFVSRIWVVSRKTNTPSFPLSSPQFLFCFSSSISFFIISHHVIIHLPPCPSVCHLLLLHLFCSFLLSTSSSCLDLLVSTLHLNAIALLSLQLTHLSSPSSSFLSSSSLHCSCLSLASLAHSASGSFIILLYSVNKAAVSHQKTILSLQRHNYHCNVAASSSLSTFSL